MTSLTLALLALVQDQPAAPAQPSSGPSFMFPMLVIGVLFLFMIFLPERKKQKQRQRMLDALKKGDRVMTSSGLFGTVVSTTNDIVVLQVADTVRLRFSRGSIQTIVEAEKDGALEEKAEPSKA